MTTPPHDFALARVTLACLARHRFARFLVVGCVNTAFGYSVFYAVLSLTNTPTLAVVVMTVAGTLFNFFSIGALVFGSSAKHLLLRFVLVYAFIGGANAVALRLLAIAGVAPAIGQAPLLPMIAVLSYILNRQFVFLPSRPRG